MSPKLEVRIVKLEPMRVAATHGFGQGPESLAWEKMLAWLEPAGLKPKMAALRFFGFNNPDPTPGSPNYGYEQWVTVGPEVEPSSGVEVKDFPGGLYAVARCQGPQNIFETWKALLVWCENSPYKMVPQQCLEECLSRDLVSGPATAWEQVWFDLYLPVMA